MLPIGELGMIAASALTPGAPRASIRPAGRYRDGVFLESQIFGVLVGAGIAALAGALLEVSRRRADRRRRSQGLRQQTHADAIRDVYDVRESLIRLFVVTDSLPPAPRPRTREQALPTAADYKRDRDEAFAGYDRAGRKLGETIHLVEAFGSAGAHAAVREFAHVTSWYVGAYLQTPVEERLDLQDLENVMEYLIGALCAEARKDSDADHGSRTPAVPHRDGKPTWLGALEEHETFRAARDNEHPAETAST